MIKADVLVNIQAWRNYISNPNVYLRNKLKKAEKKVPIFKRNKLKFTILLSGDIKIKKLIKKFRKKNRKSYIV